MFFTLCSTQSGPCAIWDFWAEISGFYFTLYRPRSGPRTIWEFWRVFRVYFILCSTLGGPCAIWDFWRSFYSSISLYIVLRAGQAQIGNFGGILGSISFYVVLGAGRAQFGIFGGCLWVTLRVIVGRLYEVLKVCIGPHGVQVGM